MHLKFPLGTTGTQPHSSSTLANVKKKYGQFPQCSCMFFTTSALAKGAHRWVTLKKEIELDLKLMSGFFKEVRHRNFGRCYTFQLDSEKRSFIVNHIEVYL